MLFPFLLMVADCADPETARGAREIAYGAKSCVVPKSDRSPTEAEKANVREAADLVLLDGPSARFKFDNVRGETFTCGMVNAKNRMGAYTGWSPFIYTIEDKSFEVYSEPERQWLYALVCKGEKPNR